MTCYSGETGCTFKKCPSSEEVQQCQVVPSPQHKLPKWNLFKCFRAGIFREMELISQSNAHKWIDCNYVHELYITNTSTNQNVIIIVQLVFQSYVYLLILVLTVILIATFIPATSIIQLSFLISTLLSIHLHMVLMFYICYELAKKASITQCLRMKYQTQKHVSWLQDLQGKLKQMWKLAQISAPCQTNRKPQMIMKQWYSQQKNTDDRAAEPTDSINAQEGWLL